MNGHLDNGVWVQVERLKGKTVLGTKTLFKRKIGKDGQIEIQVSLRDPGVSPGGRVALL